jgi:hypothetical protein
MMPNPGVFSGDMDARQPRWPAGQAPSQKEVLSRPDQALLGFVAEMYAVQLDQLAVLLASQGEPTDSAAARAGELVARWRAAGLAESEKLSLGEPWTWATRKGLAACGLRTKVTRPTARFLRHTHAVTDVRLAIQETPAFRNGGGWWRAERSILAELEWPGRPEHVPDGEVLWPAGTGSPSAGQVWAVEVEISRKSVERTASIMREVLARTSDYGTSAAASAQPGAGPRYAGLVYLCSSTVVKNVLEARAEVGFPLAARIEVYDLPESAMRLNTVKRGWQA